MAHEEHGFEESRGRLFTEPDSGRSTHGGRANSLPMARLNDAGVNNHCAGFERGIALLTKRRSPKVSPSERSPPGSIASAHAAARSSS